MAKSNKITHARILRDEIVDEIRYLVNQVVAFPSRLAATLEKAGAVDTDPDSVGYALSLTGEVVTHSPSSTEDPESDAAAQTDPGATGDSATGLNAAESDASGAASDPSTAVDPAASSAPTGDAPAAGQDPV